MQKKKQKGWPMKIFGNDANGNPILYVHLGSCNWSKAKKGLYFNEMLQYLTLHQEVMLKKVRSQSKNSKKYFSKEIQPQYDIVFDLEGLSWR